MATIEDVARLAGVSVATVSRTINDPGAVKASTAERVQGAIRQLSYTPNLSARNLRRNESRVILMMAPNFTNPYYSRVLSGICERSRALGYITLIYDMIDTLALRESLLAELIGTYKVDGAILLACNEDDGWIDRFASDIPIVFCSEYPEATSLPHVSIDNYAAAKESVLHLVSLGHRDIALVNSANRFLSNVQRARGYRDALREAGIPCDANLTASGSVDYSFESGKAAAKTLLACEKRPTAVFCVSDLLALGVIAQAMEEGLPVPDGLSVIGFDDVDYTTMFHPYLTTVGVPCRDLGVRAMEMLHASILKSPPAPVTLPHRIIARESCAPLKLS